MTTNDTIKLNAKEQYRDSSNLNARASLHERFSVNPKGWFQWYFDHVDLPEQSQVLEVGCGPASLWRDVLQRVPSGWKITLTDFSSGMAHEAQQHLNAVSRQFQFAVNDAQALPFPDNTFDAVLANHMLYHVPDPDRAIAEFRRVLKPGGKLYAATNGARHIAELHELAGRLAPDLIDTTLIQLRFGSKNFRLEDGAEQLLKSFEDVCMERYPDHLEVTEAQALVNYLLSMINPSQTHLSPERIAQFTHQLEDEIRAHGAIHITKDTGLFTAE
jgi:ubiquinone/menaquinone biosynthesis C-methylase UbiE